jgi:cytochrome c2
MPPKKKVAGDAGKGEKLFKSLCAVCHALGSHGTGPKLGGVYGKAAA